MANPISNLGIIPQVTIANRVFTDLSMVMLVGATSSNTLSGFRKYNTARANESGTTGIYAPSGLTFVIWAVRFDSITATTNFEPQLGYADTAIGFDTAGASPPTTPLYFGGLGGGFFTRYSTSANTISEYFVPGLVIPNGKYPFVNVDAGGATRIQLFGYEV